ncbi:MAG: type II toxin-antitoxin system HicB family antitoxin [Phycisphaerae bacterium]|nr:type II toxin-antitoxin system HicB family antitoxin [Phycisphaerae bacterium]
MAVVERDEDGEFFSYSPSLPGAVSQGDTADEALENLTDALAGCITSYLDSGESIPWVDEPEKPKDAVITKWIDVN